MNEQLQAKLKHYRMNSSEYELMKKLLGREPQGVEWALFSALWSEHCSYKSSKIHLRKFSYRNQSIMESEGENAGIVDLGYGEKIAFKMESHNHPSFIEPYQGAATGVGGILRDIFTMGARPIALADYLCFGQIEAERMKTLVNGVVKGISGYGNCVGVPTVSGQTEFDESYNKNILVNAMAVGLLTEGDPIALSKAKGPGNWIVYVGAKTGKDGVHGASMASESFDDKNEAKKPNVQIGDPFFEKLLIESCLQILKENLVVAMQDMGAAGLTSSSFEMASKGQVGFDIDLDQVPQRDSSITPEEILLSESQERMLLVCEPHNYQRIEQVFAQWGLDAKKIGVVKAERFVTLKWHNEVLTSIDPDLLVENAPRYERPYNAWKSRNKISADEFKQQTQTINLQNTFVTLQKHPSGVGKKSIYRQYDQRVGLRTIRGAEQAVAFLRLPSQRALAITTGCRPALMKMDAQVGAYDAVFYPALQMAIKGAKALAITDCLNFANPEKLEIMSEFVTSVESIAEAAQKIDAPVISGNVSFYNETLGRGITSTPATGVVGLRANRDAIPWDEFQNQGDVVYWLRLPMVQTFAFTDSARDKVSSWTGTYDPDLATRFVRLNHELATYYTTSKTVGRGGLAYTLMRMSLNQGASFHSHSQKLNEMSERDYCLESLYEVVVSVSSQNRQDFEKKYAELAFAGTELHWIGFVDQGPVQLRTGEKTDKKQFVQKYEESYEAFMA